MTCYGCKYFIDITGFAPVGRCIKNGMSLNAEECDPKVGCENKAEDKPMKHVEADLDKLELF